MPRAKFSPDPFKTVAVHKEQRNEHIDRFSFIRWTERPMRVRGASRLDF